MLEFAGGRKATGSKCYVTHGTMGHLDLKQPPIKRKPYAAILAIPFTFKVELILPKELYKIIQDDLATRFPAPLYSRVILHLSSMVEGDFFNNYIKKGNILMLSEGVHGVDNVFSLKDGVLTLALDKESYERAGLVGKPDGVKGKRGTRPRWSELCASVTGSILLIGKVVEINFRLPSMLHGKKGFDRIVYAFKNVLTKPVTWLFSDLGAQGISPELFSKHFPVTVSCAPEISPETEVKLPRLQPPNDQRDMYEDEFSDFAVEIYEWLSLISLGSPRVNAQDQIDPFLSRYSPPSAEAHNFNVTEVVKITWSGFLSSSWAHKIFVQALLAAKSEMWFSFAMLGFNESIPRECGDCTILKLAGARNEYVLWEVEQG